MTGQFSTFEDELILDNWEHCHGNPKALKPFLPGRSSRQIKDHIQKSQKFINKLHDQGIPTKSEEHNQEFLAQMQRRSQSNDITLETKTKFPQKKQNPFILLQHNHHQQKDKNN